MSEFQGMLPAVVTPFDPEGRFCPSAFEALLERLFEAGVHGVYVCGQTGEGLLQPVAQRKQVAEVAVRCAPPHRQVIVHVGALTTADAVDLARHAYRSGAHAVSSLPPLGNFSFAEIRAYYRTLAEASDLPLLVYFFPDICPIIRTTEQILELLEIPNVIGLKFTDFNLYQLSLLRQQDAVVFNGRDEVLVAGLLMGASGGIGSFYNLVPQLFLQVWEHSRQQRWQEAREAQRKINELIEITLRFPVFPVIKKILAWRGLNCGECLPPHRPLTTEEEAVLRELLLGSSVSETLFAGPAVL